MAELNQLQKKSSAKRKKYITKRKIFRHHKQKIELNKKKNEWLTLIYCCQLFFKLYFLSFPVMSNHLVATRHFKTFMIYMYVSMGGFTCVRIKHSRTKFIILNLAVANTRTKWCTVFFFTTTDIYNKRTTGVLLN